MITPIPLCIFPSRSSGIGLDSYTHLLLEFNRTTIYPKLRISKNIISIFYTNMNGDNEQFIVPIVVYFKIITVDTYNVSTLNRQSVVILSLMTEILVEHV